MTAHAGGEEQLLYPAIGGTVQGSNALADDAMAEHAAVKGFLAGERLLARRVIIGADKMAQLGDLFEKVKATVVTGGGP